MFNRVLDVPLANNLLQLTEDLRRSSSTLVLGKGNLDSPYLLIPLISTKNTKLKPWTHTDSSFPWVAPGTKWQNSWSSFIYSFFVHSHSTKNQDPHWLISFISTRPLDQNKMSSFIYSFFCKRPFEQNIRSSFIHSFFRGRPFDQKLGSLLIYFFSCIRPFDQN